MWLFPYRCSPASGPMSLHPRYPSFFLPGRITSPIWATKKEGQQWTLQRQLKGIQHVPVRPSSCLSYIKLSLCLLWTQPLLSLFQSMRDYLMSSFSSFRSLSETSNTSIECSADHPAFSIRFSMLFSKVEILSFSAAFCFIFSIAKQTCFTFVWHTNFRLLTFFHSQLRTYTGI